MSKPTAASESASVSVSTISAPISLAAIANCLILLDNFFGFRPSLLALCNSTIAVDSSLRTVLWLSCNTALMAGGKLSNGGAGSFRQLKAGGVLVRVVIATVRCMYSSGILSAQGWDLTSSCQSLANLLNFSVQASSSCCIFATLSPTAR